MGCGHVRGRIVMHWMNFYAMNFGISNNTCTSIQDTIYFISKSWAPEEN